MILRKPYAFLIKNFKLLHAVMSFFMLYVGYRTMNVLKTFNDYFASGTALIGVDTVSSAYNVAMFILPIIIVIIGLILFWVMAFKKKPSTLYVFITGIYIFAFVMLVLGKNILTDMEASVIDIRFIKMVRDLMTISFILELYPTLKVLSRAVGFDIKKFDFGKDLQELEIEEKDSEEVEVSVSFDKNNLKKFYNRKIRKFKYAYKENKVLMNIVMALIVVIIGSVTVYNVFIKEKKFSIASPFQISGFTFKVNDAYVTRKSYKGSLLPELEDNASVIVIPFSVTNQTSLPRGFLTANVVLNVNGYNFKNDETYRDLLLDIGTIYRNDEIKSKETLKRVFVFKVPTSYLNKKMSLKFITSLNTKGKNLIPTYVSVNINPKDLDADIKKQENELSNTLNFEGSILNKSSLNIMGAEIADKFKVDYNYTIGEEVIPSYEYITAPLETNYDRTLLKLTYDINLDENINFNSFYDIISRYGAVRYYLEGKEKTISNLVKADPSSIRLSKSLYIALPKEVKESENIYLDLKVRNKVYTYNITVDI